MADYPAAEDDPDGPSEDILGSVETVKRGE